MKNLALLLLFTNLVFGYSGGDGSIGSPYMLSNTNDIFELADATGDYHKAFVMTTDIDFSSFILKQALIAKSTGTSEEFDGQPFNGVFDGNGFAIKNFKSSNANGDYLGIFGFAETNSLIKNLGVDGCEVSGYNYVSGICGVNAGIISNSYALGVVEGAAFVGLVSGQNMDGKIIKTYASGDASGAEFVGVLCGVNDFGIIEQSYATGNTIGTVAEPIFLATLCGFCSLGEINNSYAEGNVVSDSSSAIICGYNEFGIINNCYALGNVVGNSDVGVLCGQNRGDITNSFWSLDTTGETNDFGMGLTSSAFQEKQTFTDVGWNFVDIWTMSTNAPFYPKLISIAIDNVPAPIAFYPDFVEMTSTSFVARWSAPFDVASYQLDVFEGDGITYLPGYENFGTILNSENVMGLYVTNSYYYRVRALYTDGRISGYSNKVRIDQLVPEPVCLSLLLFAIAMVLVRKI